MKIELTVRSYETCRYAMGPNLQRRLGMIQIDGNPSVQPSSAMKTLLFSDRKASVIVHTFLSFKCGLSL